MRRRFALVALLAAFALIVAACGDDDDAGTTEATTATTEATTTTAAPETTTTTAPPETTTTEATETTEAPPPPPEGLKLCQVTDVGGIDDKSFNETAWAGAQQARDELGYEIAYLESQAATDYRPNIDAFIAEGCDLIVSVGFLMGEDTALAAGDNPDQKFAIIDFGYEEPIPNVRTLNFATDEAAFLAGYLAAGMSETGVVGTFGGINIFPVTIFMNGFVQGVNYYNAEKGEGVVVLGWDLETQDGLFTGNFESLDDGRAFAQNLLDEGADIILPVAGPVGLGSAAVCQETAACLMIGVDADQYNTAPEFADVWLTSILKNMDAAVFNTAVNIQGIGSLGNPYTGTIANGGVGLAPFHDLESAVPAELAAELEALEALIAAGGIPQPAADE
jgi:basic membrane protein A